MKRELVVHSAGPGVTIQDLGRTGYLAFGVSRGGAADVQAMFEGAALLDQSVDLAALEMAEIGGQFEFSCDTRFALTGARMRAHLNGATLQWSASHLAPKGSRLTIGAVEKGVYGYLHMGGGIATEPVLGSQSVHGAAGIGAPVQPRDRLPLGPDTQSGTGLVLSNSDDVNLKPIRVLPSLQTALFDDHEIERFSSTTFQRGRRGNRMGVRLEQEGKGFSSAAGLSVLSEVIVPGDIQITGDGSPFVLLCECQTTGGYPRIGTVLPTDLPRVAQTRPGEPLRFAFVTLDQAVEIERQTAADRQALRKRLVPLIRDPANIDGLLAMQLISGVTSGDDLDDG